MPTFTIRDRVTGRVRVDLSSQITKILGQIDTGTGSGAINVGEFSLGVGWWSFLPNSDAMGFNMPTVSIVGNQLRWSASSSPRNITIVYGIY